VLSQRVVRPVRRVEGDGVEVTVETQGPVGRSRQRREDVGLLRVDLDPVDSTVGLVERRLDPVDDGCRRPRGVLRVVPDERLGEPE